MPDVGEIARSLAEDGRDVAGGRVRVVLTRTGVAVGFPAEPFVHLSWGAIATGTLLALAWRRRRPRRRRA